MQRHMSNKHRNPVFNPMYSVLNSCQQSRMNPKETFSLNTVVWSAKMFSRWFTRLERRQAVIVPVQERVSRLKRVFI